MIPSGSTVLTLITSRTALAGLSGITRMPLRPFDEPESVTLLRRVSAYPHAGLEHDELLREIARRCGNLPQALAALGAHMRHHPDWTLQDHVDALGDLVLSSDVSAALRVSYDGLSEQQRRTLRLLATSPCADVTAESCAALIDVSVADAAAELASLYQAHLLQAWTKGRFELHALVANYVAHRARVEEPATRRLAAVTRLCDYYLATTRIAAATAFPHETQVVEDGVFTSKTQAAHWLDAELANLLTAAEYMASNSPHRQQVTELALSLRRFLEITGRHSAGERLHQLAVEAATNDTERANALNTLAVTYFRQARYLLALEIYEEALALFTRLGDRARIGAVLGNLGSVHQRLGDPNKALDFYERSLRLRQDAKDRVGEGHTLTNIGFLHQQHGRHEKALSFLERGAAIFREIEDHTDLGIALGNIAACRRDIGDLEGAYAIYLEVLEMVKATEDKVGEVDTYKDLGILHRIQGQLDHAHACHETAVALSRELEDPLLHAECLLELGRTLTALGRHEAALERLLDAVKRSRDLDERRLKLAVLRATAACLDNLGRDSSVIRAELDQTSPVSER